MLHKERLDLLLVKIYVKSVKRGGERGGLSQMAAIPGLTDEQTVVVT